MFGLFLSFLPTMGLLWYLTESDRVMFLSFWIWCAVYSASGLLVARSRCPRCGKFFDIKHGAFGLRWSRPFTRRCLNCGLPLRPSSPPERDMA